MQSHNHSGQLTAVSTKWVSLVQISQFKNSLRAEEEEGFFITSRQSAAAAKPAYSACNRRASITPCHFWLVLWTQPWRKQKLFAIYTFHCCRPSHLDLLHSLHCFNLVNADTKKTTKRFSRSRGLCHRGCTSSIAEQMWSGGVQPSRPLSASQAKYTLFFLQN